MELNEPTIALRNTLQALQDNPPHETHGGICSHVYDGIWRAHGRIKAEAAGDALEVAFQTWPEFSGYLGFPVPSTTPGMSARSAYMIAEDTDMWNADHPYGAARLRLLQHLIDTAVVE